MPVAPRPMSGWDLGQRFSDRKSTRLNSSHANISYAVFCLKKTNKDTAGNAHPPHAPSQSTGAAREIAGPPQPPVTAAHRNGNVDAAIAYAPHRWSKRTISDNVSGDVVSVRGGRSCGLDAFLCCRHRRGWLDAASPHRRGGLPGQQWLGGVSWVGSDSCPVFFPGPPPPTFPPLPPPAPPRP